MNQGPDLSTFQKKLAERRAEQERREREAAAAAAVAEDDIPEIEGRPRTETDLEIDSVIDRIDILDAYARWCGKMRPRVSRGQRESIMISCPIPGHIDEDPSAWINLDKQVWHCGGCEVGGDKFDLAAMRHGLSDYKSGANFHRLREAMAEDFGYQIKREIDGSTTVIPPADEPTPEANPQAQVEGEASTDTPAATSTDTATDEITPPDAEVIHLYEDPDEEMDMPTLDWRPVTPPETFLDAYMKATIIDDVPEEYHFFHALIALGFACGRKVALWDSVPVYGNLFICTLGRSGTGKSKARRHLDALLGEALPFNGSVSPPQGVKRVNAPGSAENLIFQFQHAVVDPNNPKAIAYFDPVKGLVDFNELSSLVGRTNRQGSVLKPTLMQFYDMDNVVQTSSMTTGSKEAHEPFASAITTSQPKALSGLISQADESSGFLNRWVFVTGAEKRRIAVGGAQINMDPAVKPLQEVLAWASSFPSGRLEWETEALAAYEEWFHATWEPTRRKSTNDLLIRIDLTVKKLILLFAANRLERKASRQSVLDALHCFPYLVATYGIPEGQIGNTKNNEIAEAVIDRMKYLQSKTGRGVTIRDIYRALHRRKYDVKDIQSVLEALAKVDIIELEPTPVRSGPGRPTKRYRYVGGE